MKLKKERVKEYACAALAMFPLYGIASWCIAYKRTSDLLNFKARQSEYIQGIIDSFPKNQDEYNYFLKNGEDQVVEIYNQAYADVKLDGEVSQEFLNANGFESKDQFFDKLDLLYSQGGENPQAKEEFNQLMADYENDFFGQATDLASINYHEQLNQFGYIEFDPSILDTINVMDPKALLIGIGSVGLLFCIYDEYKKAKMKRLGIEKKKKQIIIPAMKKVKQKAKDILSNRKSQEDENSKRENLKNNEDKRNCSLRPKKASLNNKKYISEQDKNNIKEELEDDSFLL